MIRMTVQDLLDSTGAELVCGTPDVVFEGVCIDSRKVEPGGAFVAFAGERVDGNRYAVPALEAGAHVVVLSSDPSQEALEAARQTDAVLVRCADDDGEAFMLALAEAWRRQNPQWVVVGVTGSVGKTTTKDMLATGIGACRRTHATSGNFNNLLGVPLTLFAASPEDEVLVVEMGMNNAGELARIVKAARPCVAAITNVGTSHIGNLGSRENIARAKAEVAGGLVGISGVEPTLVLSDADEYTDFIEREYCEPAGIRVLRVGGAGIVCARDVTLDAEGHPTTTVAFADGMSLEASLSLPGRAMVLDLLSALGVIEALGLSRERALEAICRMKAPHMRLDVRQQGSSARVIDDSYNASPASMASALDVLCSMACEGRRVAVLGEMGELGVESRHLHALTGAYAAAKPIDLLVLIGTGDACAMAEAALTMGFSADRLERFDTVEHALGVMAPLFVEDDLVLVKASRAAGLDLFAKGVLSA